MPYEGAYTWTDDQSVGAYVFNRYVRDNLLHMFVGSLPTRQIMYHDESLVTAGNAIARTVDGAQYFTFYAAQNPSADGDTFTQSVVLLPGTYQMSVYGRKTSSSGQLTLTIGSLEIDSQRNFYNGSTLDAQTVTDPIFTIDDGKRYVITGTVDGKDASSSGYDIDITYMAIVPYGPAGGDI
jgi:hypothetical protein